jgi:hypothetical protein
MQKCQRNAHYWATLQYASVPNNGKEGRCRDIVTATLTMANSGWKLRSLCAYYSQELVGGTLQRSTIKQHKISCTTSKRERKKNGHESCGTLNQELLRYQGTAAIY